MTRIARTIVVVITIAALLIPTGVVAWASGPQTISATASPRVVTAGRSVSVVGRISPRTGGQVVALSRRETDGSFTLPTAQTTREDGSFKFVVKPAMNSLYRVTWNNVNSDVRVLVRPGIAFRVTPNRIVKGRRVRVTGSISTGGAARVILYWKLRTMRKWKVVAATRVKAKRFAFRWRPPNRGVYEFKISFRGSGLYFANKVVSPKPRRPVYTSAFPVGGSKRRIWWNRLRWTRARMRAGRVHHDYPAVDIMAPHGYPIYNFRAGSVIQVRHSGESNKGGNTVTVRSYDGRVYYYAHMRTIKVRRGQRVYTGQKIGTVGSSGNASASAPHLHFGVSRPGGVTKGSRDPFPLLIGPWRAAFLGWKGAGNRVGTHGLLVN